MKTVKKYPFNNAGNTLSTLIFPASSVTFLCSDGTFDPCDMSEGNIVTRLLDRVVVKNGKNVEQFRLEGEWRYSQSKLNEFVAAGDTITISKSPFRPNYVNRSGSAKKTANLLSHRTSSIPANEDATDEMRALMNEDVFDHPKPVGLISFLIRATMTEGIVLDFFAGSGTTGHAVISQNASDGGKRHYILVQLPEPLDPENKEQKTASDFCDRMDKPRTIAELTKERLRRAGKKVKADNAMVAGDTGFRVFKLDSSNIRAWDPKPENVTQQVIDSTIHIKPDRLERDILTELLLKLGLDLTVPIESKAIAKKKVHSIGAGTLIVCLEESITLKDAEPLAMGITKWHKELAPAGESTIVFRDSAFDGDDVAKSNLAAILQQHGLMNVRSL